MTAGRFEWESLIPVTGRLDLGMDRYFVYERTIRAESCCPGSQSDSCRLVRLYGSCPHVTPYCRDQGRVS